MSKVRVAEDWQDDEVIDLAVIGGTLWSRRWWIIASVIAGAVLFGVYAFTATPIYRASVLLIPSDSGRGSGLEGALGQLGGLASLAGIQVGESNSAKQEALAVMRSRELTDAFIQSKNLMPVLFANQWDARRQQWKPNIKPPTPADAYRYFDERIRSISDDKKTGLVKLQIHWKDRLQAAEWANELVSGLNKAMRARAIAAAEASVGYLEREQQATSTVTTRDAISRLIEAQIKQRMLANVSKEYAFRVVDKAIAPDADDPVRPRKVMLIAGGGLVGMVLSVSVILIMGFGVGSRRRAYTGNAKSADASEQ
jgi:uncharacterized protein involved in exopolysaccharide biosynthesis